VDPFDFRIGDMMELEKKNQVLLTGSERKRKEA
jgi:hypothetical protein